eukprot:1251943-Pyramimonas_sp.AAC.1
MTSTLCSKWTQTFREDVVAKERPQSGLPDPGPEAGVTPGLAVIPLPGSEPDSFGRPAAAALVRDPVCNASPARGSGQSVGQDTKDVACLGKGGTVPQERPFRAV